MLHSKAIHSQMHRLDQTNWRSRLLKFGVLALLILSFNAFAYNGGRYFAQGKVHYGLTTSLDREIPFLPWMVSVYWGCYMFWVLNYILGIKQENGKGAQFLGAHFIGETLCFILFVLFPTSMARPAISGNTVFDQALRLTYRLDAPNNLFPSIHCFASWLCWIGVRSNKKVPVWYRFFSLFMAVAVCVSTLTVKQHVLADVASGILVAELSYFVSGRLIQWGCQMKSDKLKKYFLDSI